MKNLLSIHGLKAITQKILLLKAALPVLLAVAGLTLISVGIGMIFTPGGVIVGGLSLLLLEQRAERNTEGRR